MSSSAGTAVASSATSVVVVAASPVTAMDIGEAAFRPEDISKGDFFDFVSAPVTPSSAGTTPIAAAVDRQALTLCNNNSSNNNGSANGGSNNNNQNSNGNMASASLN